MSCVLSVGGIAIGSPALQDQAAVPEHLHQYLRSAADALALFDLHAGPPPPREPQARLLFDSGGVWQVRQHGNGIRIDLHVEGRVYQSLLLDEGLTRGVAVLDSAQLSADDPEAGFALRAPMLELWISFLLMRGRGLLVHGLGVLGRDGDVHVFVGKSGAGKSTLAGVVVEAGAGRVLSDDRLIVRPTEAGFAVYGTPWHGEARHALNASGQLVRLHFLEQAADSACVPLSPAEAARRLFACCFVAGWPRAGIAHVLEQCARLASRVRCDVLRFRPDSSALRAAGLHW